MQKAIIIVSFIIGLAGCSFFPGVHKIDIQQGNLVTQEMVDQLRPGMTKRQVRFVLGTPLIMDTFNQQRWDYLFTFKEGGEPRQQERLTLFFEDDALTHFNGNFRPLGAAASE
ncbi:outer membrane protein assembly factor BamE [Motiliproteus sp. SC1-56]|uniref:outer membrane protein assembly factor BamE n=1 Tax=Motiliproteus sp. SC1-56 TaxID=2799565 RepID=UPI001A8D2C01|nr:outer membrane protein assembly factor BamE [Motiliproteus sp. SC1-56]